MVKYPLYFFKVYLLGKKGVGKSTFVNTCDPINDHDNGMVIGLYFRVYDYSFNPRNKEELVKFSIYIQNPADRFKQFLSTFVTGSNAILIMFDISDHSSLDEIDDWMSVISNKPRCRDVPIMLLGNKADLTKYLANSKLLADSLVKKYSLTGYYEISAFKASDIESIFAKLANILLKKLGYIR